MAILQDPRTDGLTSDTDVSFHYKQRVACLIAGVAAAALGAVFLGDRVAGDLLPQAAWAAFLMLAILLVVVLVAADLQRHLSAALRWLALLLSALVAAHFGEAASLKGQTRSIVEIELAGSSEAWRACACGDAITSATRQDFWFILSYVLLLGLLALWAGAYFRLPAIRRVRFTVVIAVVVAGVFDVAENILMLTAGSSDGPWQFVAVFAWAKFTLLLVAIVYSAAGAFAWWSTPRWVRLASWALPTLARKAAGMAPTAAPSDQVAQAAEGNQTHRTAPPPGKETYGIALSGGGMRASSISLGVLQTLDRSGLNWAEARAVTAVSGGSNMAAGWSISRSSLATTNTESLQRATLRQQAPEPWQQQANGWLTPEERHLVNNLGYLGSNEPRGSETDPVATSAIRTAYGDQASAHRPSAYTTIITGLIINVVVLLCIFWAIARPVGWALRSFSDRQGELQQSTMHELVKEHTLARPGLVFLVVGFAVLVLWAPISQLLIGSVQNNVWARITLQTLKRASYSAFALGALLVLALWAFVELVGAVAQLSLPALIAGATAGVGVIGSVVRTLKKPTARFAPRVGGYALAVAMCLAAMCFTALSTWTAAKRGVSWSARDLTNWQSGWNWVLALLVVAFVLLGPSPESWSLAPVYRRRLRVAYATYRSQGPQAGLRVQAYENDDIVSADSTRREPGLHAFNYDNTAVRTPLVVCTTSPVTSRAVRTHYGTPALSVTFAPERTVLHLPQDGRGNTLQFAVSTRVLDQLGTSLNKRITTMMAAAISSAAVSPAKGQDQFGPTSMLLTFFNIRLGVWIANPRFITQLEAAGLQDNAGLRYARTGLGYLFKEFLGIHDLDDPYIYLTDGRGWESTGLVELLRIPEITETVCIDADPGSGEALSSLGKAIALAASECDIRIDISLDPLRATPSDCGTPAYCPRTVNIGFFTKGAGAFTSQTPVGVLWYAEAGLAKEMPASLLAFHERDPSYPREPTFDQFFDTASFVAYRNFGRYNARQILVARRKLQEALDDLLMITDPTRLDECLKAMAVDPARHWAIAELSRAAHSAASTAYLVTSYCHAVQTSLMDST